MKKVVGALAAFLYGTSALYGATLLPNGQQQFIDANGKPYANGKVYFYSNFPTCTILKNTYQNEAGTVLNTNPVVLSASGTATIFGTGAYCQVLKDQLGNTIWTKYTSDTSSASNLGWGGTSGGTANAQTVSVSSFTSVNGQSFYFVAGATNNGPLTLSVNGGPQTSVVRSTPTGTLALAGGEVVLGNVVGVTYVSATGQFQLITNTTQPGYVGEVRSFAMASCPGGWLYADGAAVSAVTYANLFAVITTTWGTSPGNVVLPDLRNQFLRGDGTQSVGFTELSQNKTHTHVATATSTVPDHSHTYVYPNGGVPVSAGGLAAAAGSGSGSTSSQSLTITTSVTNAAEGGTEARPDNKRMRFCIKY